MKPILRAAPVFGLLSLLVAAPLAGQTPAEIVDRMLDAHEQSAASVENYSVVQEVMGFRSELYFEKETRDGRPVFVLRSSATDGGAATEVTDEVGYTDVYAEAPTIAEHARYGGTEQVNGAEAHVLVIDDLSALDLVPTAAPDGGEFQPKTGRILVDADLWVPRRMEFTGDFHGPEGPVEVTSIVDLEDYRDDQGLLMPYRTVVRMEGLAAAIDPQMRAEFERMQQELESMPESQRAMVEQMLAGRLEQLEALMGGDDSAMTVEMRVVELRVNEGPPAR